MFSPGKKKGGESLAKMVEQEDPELTCSRGHTTTTTTYRATTDENDQNPAEKIFYN